MNIIAFSELHACFEMVGLSCVSECSMKDCPCSQYSFVNFHLSQVICLCEELLKHYVAAELSV
jgi:hypothetical protein